MSMQDHRYRLFVLSIALLIASCGAGCSRQAKKSRYLERAEL
jgi:hypothetical protein